MKALVMHEYSKLQYEDVNEPKIQENEVLVRVKACSVCGSDVHGFDGSTGRRRPPVIMGHEASGQIAKVGSKVTKFRVGDRVTFDSTVYCNECPMCKAGKVNLCSSRQVLGVSCEDYNRNGCFAEYVNIPEHILYRLPNGVSYVQAAMIEPLSVAYHAATRTKINPGDAVVVVGIGTIGLLTMQVVKSFGASKIIAVDISNERLSLAMDNGATYTINSKNEDALKKILELVPGGVDVAIDATGIEDTVNLCIRSVRLDGKVILIGNVAPSVSFPLQYVVTHQIALFGSCASSGEYPECLDLIARGFVNVDAMISKIVPLSEGDKWMNKIYHREDGLTKIVFDCEK